MSITLTVIRRNLNINPLIPASLIILSGFGGSVKEAKEVKELEVL